MTKCQLSTSGSRIAIQGAQESRANNAPTLSDPYREWCNIVATLIFLKRKGFTVLAFSN